MLTFLKTLFQKKTDAAAATILPPAPEEAPAASTLPGRGREVVPPVPQVAVARLSLVAILQKLPPELRANITKQPDETATVALPVSTIQKQLAAGSVKMSLASLYRQAPPGTFNAARVEEKRMIEVPLSEVLKHVEPQAFRRRADQRRAELPHSTPQLFGDRSNPYAIAPREGQDPEPEQQGFARHPEQHEANGVSSGEEADGLHSPMMTAPAYTLPLKMTVESVAEEPRPSSIKMTPAPAAPAAAPLVEGNVTIPLAQLLQSWPEPARAEAAALGEAQVVIPAAVLAPGVARGKVVFSWGQLRGWIQPAPTAQTEAREGTEISLPLKVVAPLFLAHTGPKAGRRETEFDETIPALFDGGEAARPVASAPVLSMRIEEPESDEPARSPLPLDPGPTLRLASEPHEEPAPADETSTPAELVLEAPVVFAEPEVTVPTDVAEPAIALEIPAEQPSAPASNGKSLRSPQAMIDSTVALPGVAGAIVALREGLVVAARMPEHMKGDTVAAFLPQIFGRLNHYTQEMKMGEVEDLLLTVDGAHFQGYRMGELYFAVLGKAGEALPWQELRQVVQELQTHSQA